MWSWLMSFSQVPVWARSQPQLGAEGQHAVLVHLPWVSITTGLTASCTDCTLL